MGAAGAIWPFTVASRFSRSGRVTRPLPIETLAGELFLESPDEIRRLSGVYEHLLSLENSI